MNTDHEELESLRSTVAELSARLDAMERRNDVAVAPDVVVDGPMSRRHALRAAGVLAAGAIAGGAGVLASASPAAATAGVFDSISVTTTGTDRAVTVVAASGPGVAVYADRAALHLDPSGAAPADRAGVDFIKGEVTCDSNGDVWLCTQNTLYTSILGHPIRVLGAWRKLGGPSSAGAFHALTPGRVHDSRPTRGGAGPMAANLGSGATGAARTISIADSIDPTTGATAVTDFVPYGATAVAANVTVTNTVGSGFLSINPGGDTAAHASTINWFGSGQNIANGVVLTLDATRQVTVLCGSGATPSTNFIIDVTGYWM